MHLSKIVVGPHGGAFSNLIFLDPAKKPKVIEFCPLSGKTFSRLFNNAIETFAEYYQIPYILPPEVEKETSGAEIINALKHVDSTIDLSEIKKVLPLIYK